MIIFESAPMDTEDLLMERVRALKATLELNMNIIGDMRLLMAQSEAMTTESQRRHDQPV